MWQIRAHVFDTCGWYETFRVSSVLFQYSHTENDDERDSLLTIINIFLLFITSTPTFYIWRIFFIHGMEKADARGEWTWTWIIKKKTVSTIRIYCIACTLIPRRSRHEWTRDKQWRKATQNLWTPPTIGNDRWDSKGVDLWLYKLYTLSYTIQDSLSSTRRTSNVMEHQAIRESNVNLFGHLNRNAMNKQFRWNKQAKKKAHACKQSASERENLSRRWISISLILCSFLLHTFQFHHLHRSFFFCFCRFCIPCEWDFL